MRLAKAYAAGDDVYHGLLGPACAPARTRRRPSWATLNTLAAAALAELERQPPTLPHRTLGLQTPEPRPCPVAGPIQSRPVLNGLHHVYERAA